MSLVGVIMSVYEKDSLDSVIKSVSSILSQSYSRLVLYIMIDGKVSSPVNMYLESVTDARLFLFKRDINRGLAHSLNELLIELLKNTTIKYIARMDADDFSHSTRIEKQVDFLDRNSDIDIVGSYIYEYSGSKQALVKYPLKHEAMRKIFGKRNPLAHPTVMFRVTYFKHVGLYPVDSIRDEDTEFWLKGFLCENIRFANIPEPLVTMSIDSDFYKRRRGVKKSYSDFKNRCKVIKKLNLSLINYLFSLVRFMLFALMPSFVLKLAYRKIRK